MKLHRVPPREGRFYVPQPVAGQRGVFRVDGTWGTIQPMRVCEGIETVGEMELLEHLERGGALVDSRVPETFRTSTIPGAVNIPFAESVERMGELDEASPTVFFCNGPACGQSPTALRALAAAGFPTGSLLYYRGGMHAWMTLGLPVVRADASEPASE